MITGHNVQVLANLAGGATGAQPAVTVQLGPKLPSSVQVELSGAGTVTIEGRMDPTASYRALAVQLAATGAVTTTATASGIYVLLTTMTDMRANVSVNAGTCKVWLQA